MKRDFNEVNRRILETKPCGSYAKYIAGHRYCAECRAAGLEYLRLRRLERKVGNFQGLVSAAKTRRHLQALTEEGCGTRLIADLAFVSRTLIMQILRGKKKIKAASERSILAIKSKDITANDGALIDSAKTKEILAELRDGGYTWEQLSAWLGLMLEMFPLEDRPTVEEAQRLRDGFARSFPTLEEKLQELRRVILPMKRGEEDRGKQ